MAIIRRILRDADGNEEVFVPYKDEMGNFVMATKRTAEPLNHLSNQVLVRSQAEVIEKLRTGKYSLRMTTGRGPNNLISGKSIEIID